MKEMQQGEEAFLKMIEIDPHFDFTLFFKSKIQRNYTTNPGEVCSHYALSSPLCCACECMSFPFQDLSLQQLRAFHYIRCSFVNRINRRGELFFFISALNALVWSVRGAMTMFNEAILMVWHMPFPVLKSHWHANSTTGEVYYSHQSDHDRKEENTIILSTVIFWVERATLILFKLIFIISPS